MYIREAGTGEEARPIFFSHHWRKLLEYGEDVTIKIRVIYSIFHDLFPSSSYEEHHFTYPNILSHFQIWDDGSSRL